MELVARGNFEVNIQGGLLQNVKILTLYIIS